MPKSYCQMPELPKNVKKKLLMPKSVIFNQFAIKEASHGLTLANLIKNYILLP